MEWNVQESAKKTTNNFLKTISLLFGVLLLVALIITAIPKNLYSQVFTGNPIFDPLIGSVLVVLLQEASD